MKFPSIIVAVAVILLPAIVLAANPTVMTETWASHVGTTFAFAYDIPDGGTNKMIVLDIYKAGSANLPTVTVGGQAITTSVLTTTGGGISAHWVGYIATSSNGVPSISVTCNEALSCGIFVYTLQDVDTVNPIDAKYFINPGNGTTPSISTTTVTGNDLLVGSVDMSSNPTSISWTSSGAVTMLTGVSDSLNNPLWDGSWAYQPAGASPATETMSALLGSAKNPDMRIVAWKGVAAAAAPAPISNPSVRWW